jgi:hypothetical protein
MGFDAIRGAGYIPPSNPANLYEVKDMSLTGVDDDEIVISINDNLTTTFAIANITWTGGVSVTTPQAILFINDQEIDRVLWGVDLNTIRIGTGQKNVYKFEQQIPYSLHKGDSVKLWLGQTGVGNSTFVASLNVLGNYY